MFRLTFAVKCTLASELPEMSVWPGAREHVRPLASALPLSLPTPGSAPPPEGAHTHVCRLPALKSKIRPPALQTASFKPLGTGVVNWERGPFLGGLAWGRLMEADLGCSGWAPGAQCRI